MTIQDADQAAVLPLENLLCFDLYEATRALTELYRPLLDELGLDYPQYLALLAVPVQDPIGIGSVQDALSLDPTTLDAVLRRLASAGLVDRLRPNALGEAAIELTDAGRWVRGRFAGVQCVVGAAMGLEQAQFLAVQESVRQLVEAVRRATDART